MKYKLHQFKPFFLILLFSFGISGIFKLEIVTSYLRLFDHHLNNFFQFSEMEKNFGQNELIAVTISPKKGSVIQPSVLKSLQKFTDWASHQAYIGHVESLTHILMAQPKKIVGQGSDADILSLYAYAEQENFSSQSLKIIDQYIRNHGESYLYHTLITKDFSTAVMIMEYQLPQNNQSWQIARDQILNGLIIQIKEIRQQHPDWQVETSGTLWINKSFVEIMAHDAMLMSFLLHLTAVVCLFFLYRSWRIILITLIIIDISVLLTLGLQGWLNIPITQINASASAIVMTLTLCSCVHIWTNAALKKLTLQESWNQVKKAILITSMTAAVGFASLMSVDSIPFRELAYVASLGIFSSYISIYLIFPLVMKYFLEKPIVLYVHFIKWIYPCIQFSIRYPVIVMISVLLSSGYLIMHISNNQLDDNIKDYFSKQSEIRKSMDFMEKKLGGWDRLSIILTLKDKQYLYDPSLYNYLERMEKWLLLQPEVVQVLSPNDFLGQLNQLFFPMKKLILDKSEKIEDLLSSAELDEQGEKSMKIYFNESALQVRTMPLLKTLSSQNLLSLEKRINEWFEKNPNPSVKKHEATSISLLYAYLGHSVIYSMVFGSSIAVILITLILCWALKSVELGLISLLPNLLPGLLIFGAWGLFFGKVNMGIATVFAISFGVIVDDTVHLLENIQQELKAKSDKEKQITSADLNKVLLKVFSQVGSAIITTGLIVCIGFLCLGVSDFTITKQLGLMVGSTVLIALIFDLMFLPALIILYMKIKNRGRKLICAA